MKAKLGGEIDLAQSQSFADGSDVGHDAHGYAHTNIHVKRAMRRRIGDLDLRDLTAAMAQILAANIRALRASVGLNQTEFGEAIGVSQGTVARWEGGSEPKSEPLLKMAEMAGCSLQDFTSRLWSKGAERRPSVAVQGAAGGAIYMPVFLPSEAALTEMFQGLLEMLANERDQDVAAQRLAQLLPNALAQTVSRQPVPQLDPTEAPVLGATSPAPATTSRATRP
ncbi:helix-turn-helix domain-containing protein [Sphingomonas sp. YL-JM2C]